MLSIGSVLGDRFRVVRNFDPLPSSIAVAEELSSGQEYWVVEIVLSIGNAQLSAELERQWRFAVGVPGLVRHTASGANGSFAFVAFRAPEGGSVAEQHTAAWDPLRVAELATRIAEAVGPLHDQGIAYGCLTPELIASGPGPALYGFGVAGLATRFGAAGEASQLLRPEYCAPELRAALSAPTPASDVFALGVLMRELLCPLGERDAATCIELAAPLLAILERALSPDPRDRPTEASAFAAEFAAEVRRLAHSGRAWTGGAGEGVRPVAAREPELGSGSGSGAGAGVGSGSASGVAGSESRVGSGSGLQSGVASRSGSGGAWVAGVMVAAGLLLMVCGVAGAIAYAVRHAVTLAAPSSSVTVTSSPAHPLPRATEPTPSPGVTTGSPESLPGSDDAAQAAESPRSGPVHAAMVPPGVGPSSYPEESHAALPVLGTEPIWGTRRALLTWVLFGDLECPHTRRAWRALELAKASYGDDLRIVFRHRPLREHAQALEAARVLAGLAQQRGPRAFFEVLQRLMQGEASLTRERLTSELAAAGYGDATVEQLSAAGEGAVRADLQLAGQFGVRSTPYSFLNGQPIDGELTLAEIERALRTEQRSVTWSVAAGVPRAAVYTTRTNSNLIGVGEAGEARACAPVGNSPVLGPRDALVTLVEFSDFECQYCRRVEPTLKALLARYPKSLRLVWKDFPLPQHKSARLLANFAADARRRGSNAGFWKVHDGLFAESDAPDDAVLGELAGKAGLDGALLLISAHAGVHDAAIGADLELGRALDVSGTPTFFANGRRIQGAQPLDEFDALIRSELQVAKRIVAGGVAARDVYGLVCE